MRTQLNLLRQPSTSATRALYTPPADSIKVELAAYRLITPIARDKQSDEEIKKRLTTETIRC